jgi:hypothetical protein
MRTSQAQSSNGPLIPSQVTQGDFLAWRAGLSVWCRGDGVDEEDPVLNDVCVKWDLLDESTTRLPCEQRYDLPVDGPTRWSRFGLFIVSLVFLYGYLNDRKLKQLPPEAELIFSPARLTPQRVRAAAEALSTNPIVMKNFFPPKTGRRYIVVGGVCSVAATLWLRALILPPGRFSGGLDRPPTVGARRGPQKDQGFRHSSSRSLRLANRGCSASHLFAG